ncbi:MAG: EVE domain-containing protein [Ignavibacteria bacterium]|nr:EVE domain-containing protein [Ignavibacteria bacterium]
MAFWLLKTEPTVYAYKDLVRDRTATWDGVSNPTALKNIRSMKKGDLAFIYHSGAEKAIIGIAEVVKDPYPDPKKKDPRLVVVDLKAREDLKTPVTLAEVKAGGQFADFALVRIPRLSVMPVTNAQWKRLLSMSR